MSLTIFLYAIYDQLGGVGLPLDLPFWMSSTIIIGTPLLTIIGLWGMFAKAGEPGWAAMVPVYNLVVVLRITGKPVWWLALMLVPLANFIVFIHLYFQLAKVFGRGLDVALLSYVYAPLAFVYLGFSSAVAYFGPASEFRVWEANQQAAEARAKAAEQATAAHSPTAQPKPRRTATARQQR